MSDLSDIQAGVKTVLEAANGKLRVYTEPPGSPLEYPCVVCEPRIEEPDYSLDLAETTWSFVLPLTLSIRVGSVEEAWRELYKYMSPTGTESVPRGIRTDPTLSNAVDGAIIVGVRDVGRNPQEDGGGNVYGATFLVRVVDTP